MALGRSRWLLVAIVIILTVYLASSLFPQWQPLLQTSQQLPPPQEPVPLPEPDMNYVWRKVEYHHPIESYRPIPEPPATSNLGRVQAKFFTGGSRQDARQGAVKEAFLRAWSSYKHHAWLRDEVTPVTGKQKDTFGGWGATLVDSLDTLWIMGLYDEFEVAVDAIDQQVTFETTTAKEINIFETNIRFLGGLLSAYDLSGDPRLLKKARDLGDMIYKAFDTPSHLPISRWNLRSASNGKKQQDPNFILLSELGSMSLELTRLSILTNDPKYYDAIQRISELFSKTQMESKIPGLWSMAASPAEGKVDISNDYSLGPMSDSMYEYLPKMAALLGDAQNIYGEMYTKSMDAVMQNLVYRPMIPESDDILFSGTRSMVKNKKEGTPDTKLETSAHHVACFAGGMFALGGRLMGNETHHSIGDKLTRGCEWVSNSMSSGVMPESSYFRACPSLEACPWNDAKWHEGIIHQTSSRDVQRTIKEDRLPKGVTRISDTRYLLRPEVIESVFVMFRTTGDARWREVAWQMWVAIDQLTYTSLANSAARDVNPPDEKEVEKKKLEKEGEGKKETYNGEKGKEKNKDTSKLDSMESFWTAETLKYFYLIFSDSSLISLDEWVFNTEGHPLRRLRKA